MSDTTVTTLEDPADKTAATGQTPATAKTGAVKKTSAAAAKEAGISEARKKITIHQGEGTAGRDDVQVFVNGYSFLIKRGQVVEVPPEVVEVLTNAKTIVYEAGQAIEVPRFAFTVHG